MISKALVWIGVFIGSSIGGLIPLLFGMDPLSYWGIMSSGIGGLAGIWVGAQLSNYI